MGRVRLEPRRQAWWVKKFCSRSKRYQAIVTLAWAGMSSGPSQECLNGICSGTSLCKKMLQRIKFAQLWWENSNSPADLGACLPSVKYNAAAQPSGTTHTLEKTSIHCITFLPCRGISKPAGQKEGPVVEILPDLTSLQKAYLDKARRGRKQRVVNGSLGHPSYPQTAICDISHYVGFWIYYLLIFWISDLFNIISMSSLTSGSQFSLMVRLAEVWSNWICMIPTWKTAVKVDQGGHFLA